MNDPADAILVQQAFDLSHAGFTELVAESVAAGFEFVRRLRDDWIGGSNCFDKPGEAFFVALHSGWLLGVCGLNADPYSHDATIGRVRHLYVAANHRRKGIGKALLQAIVTKVEQSFVTLTLRTNSAEAAAFYVALGFTRTDDWPSTTHFLEMGSAAARALRTRPK
jgi:GNAT superfamily N-acetyltransferase